MIPEGAKKAVVVGLGISGMAVVRFLLDQGLEVAVSESRVAAELSVAERMIIRENDLRLETGGHSREFVLSGDFIVPGPGVPLALPVIKAAAGENIPILGELALAAGMFRVPVIAITGSNGKTTVTGLIGELLRACGYHPFVGGNIGTPLLSSMSATEEYDVLVLELSSFQLDISGEFRPDIALLLNLSPDHLDRHGSMAGYINAKKRIFLHQTAADYAILGGDDPQVMQLVPEIRAKIATFGHERHHQTRIAGDCVCVARPKHRCSFSLASTSLASGVNRLNAAAAVAAVKLLGASDEGITAGLASFVPAEHRMTRVAEINGVVFINDSKATNVGALAAALMSCPPGVVLIAGGRDKQGDFTAVRTLVRERVVCMVCIGEAAGMLQETFSDLVPVATAADMASAVATAASMAGEGQTVLLAPGCASYDMFTDYCARGRSFTDAVHSLAVTVSASFLEQKREQNRGEGNDQNMLRLQAGG